MRKELVEWRKGLSAGADLNHTTLRKPFPESVYKHYQRQPRAVSRWMHFANTFVKKCYGTESCWTTGLWRQPLSWTSAGRERIKAELAIKAQKFMNKNEKEQCTAYCAQHRASLANHTARHHSQLQPNDCSVEA